MLQEKITCFGGVGLSVNRNDVARHDIGTLDITMRADGSLKLDLLQQTAEIAPVDVKGFVERGKSCVEIFLAETDTQRCGQVCGLVRIDRRDSCNMRVVAPAKLVKQQAQRHQNAGIQANRHERKQQPPTGNNRPAKDGGQRCCPTRWMKAACQ